MDIVHLFISEGHNYVGHHGKAPGDNATQQVDEVECVAGRGIRGDRYFDHAKSDKGQITFFAEEVCAELGDRLADTEVTPSMFRRNVITRNIDLNRLIGRQFELQGVRFLGTEECRPCYWMDRAVGPGAEDALKGKGGLRAEILTDGVLRVD